MIRKKHIFIICVVIALLLPLVQGDWKDKFGGHQVVYLHEIQKNPESWLGVPVKIPLRFQSVRAVFNPFFTPFNKEEYINFSAWDVKTPVWTKNGFFNDYPFFYVKKDNSELQSFLRYNRFETITVLAQVEGLFKGRPYIRVVWACEMPGQLNVHNLTLMNRAMTSFSNREFDRSLTFLEQFVNTNPPEDLESFVYKTRAQIYLYETRSYGQALAQVNQGLKITQNDSELKRLYRQAKYHIKHGGVAEPYKKRLPQKKHDIITDNFLDATANNEADKATEYEPIETETASQTDDELDEELSADDEIIIEEDSNLEDEFVEDSYEEEFTEDYE